jgi:Acyl-coenzyme A:6-aminopenicillanic acid acyl-transferase
VTSPAPRGLPLTFYAVAEPEPGPGWQRLFSSAWPAYRRWYLRDGAAARTGLRECQQMLARHMPELVPTWRRLVELAGGDPLAAQMLTLYNPPPYITGCSQAVHLGAERALVRNYDYAPELFERVVLGSSFTGRRVVGTSDCLWGLVDGMNDAGLAVSLAFGGRPTTGTGFGIPLVLRYVLEVCDSAAQARQTLARLPVHMPYNVTVTDLGGDYFSVFLDPASDPVFTASPIATNHELAPAPGNVGAPRSTRPSTGPPTWRSSTAGPVRPGSTPSARSPTVGTRWCWARANGRGAGRMGGHQGPGCGRRTRRA